MSEMEAPVARRDDVRLMTFDELVADVLSRRGPVRLVAVDGAGGAGKSTFAERLSRRAGGVPVVHTDDFASWDEPLEWWPRLLTQVIEPLVAGKEARYQRFDWHERRLADWLTVAPSPVVIVEGVSSGRREWAAHLAYTILVEAPEPTRLRRGLERDGDAMLEQWRSWMAAEDSHFAADGVIDRADLIVDGEPSLDHDPDEQFVALPRRG
jgi:uridine kinase